jgi:hypothetical protein
MSAVVPTALFITAARRRTLLCFAGRPSLAPSMFYDIVACSAHHRWLQHCAVAEWAIEPHPAVLVADRVVRRHCIATAVADPRLRLCVCGALVLLLCRPPWVCFNIVLGLVMVFVVIMCLISLLRCVIVRSVSSKPSEQTSVIPRSGMVAHVWLPRRACGSARAV